MSTTDMRGGNYAAELHATTIYRNRRSRLAAMVGEGTIVVWGSGDDRGYGDVGTFRQGSDFFYLTGVELPNAVLVLRPSDDTDALFLAPRNPAVERWTGPKWGPGGEAAKALGFGEVFSIGGSEVVLDARIRPVPDFEGRIHGWLSEKGAQLHTPYPAIGAGRNLPPTHRFVKGLREGMTSFEVHDISGHLALLRITKDESEIEMMRKAIGATMTAHRNAAKAIAPGIKEALIDGVVYSTFRANGAEGLAFPSIVGSGYNATTLHYDQNVCHCSDGDLVVVDIGARYGYYCGDLTRTYPVNGSFTERQRQVYNVVLDAHDKVSDAIKPGITLFDLRKIAYLAIEESAIRDQKGERLGQYFIHGLGHFLGLDAHDPGGDNVALEPGMVITNEPGVYIPDESLGVRIEDDHLVTTDGNENLSGGLPTTTDEIEAMMH